TNWPRPWPCCVATSSANGASGSATPRARGISSTSPKSSPSPSRRHLSRPTTRPPAPARPPRRTRLDHLPHVRIEHDLPEDEKTCSCGGGPKHKIGEDLSRELDFTPAQLNVKVHVLPKYACPNCREGVASPPVPPKPIPGGIAGAGLVAFVVVSK